MNEKYPWAVAIFNVKSLSFHLKTQCLQMQDSHPDLSDLGHVFILQLQLLGYKILE